jgi:hypothetical protein
MSDFHATIHLSKDGAHNYLAPRILDLGEVGNFNKQVYAMRFGTFRRASLQWSVSSPVKCPVLGMAIQAEGES